MNHNRKKYFQEAYTIKGSHLWTIIPVGEEGRSFLQLVKEHKSTGRMIDLGCGNGKFARFFAQNGFEGYGIDYVPEAIKEAKILARKEKINNQTHFMVGNVLSMNYPAHFFDVAYDYGCWHHIPKIKWGLYLANLLKVLKKDGFFMLSVFSKNTENHFGFQPKKAKRNWLIHKKPEKLEHYDYFFTKQEIMNLFSKDFDIIKIKEKKLNLNQILQKTKLSERIKSIKHSPLFFYVQMRRKQ